MSDAIESQGTTLEIAGSAGGAETVTDIALANPTILTSVGHSLTNGDVVTAASFAGADAADINGNDYVVMYATTDTFAIALDSTSLTIDDNSNSATMTPKSWTEIGEIVDINREDPGSSEIDVTHLGSTAKEFLMGLTDSGSYSLTVNYLFDDTGQQALRTAQTNRTIQSFRVTYPDDSTMSFDGYVMTFSGPSASVDGKLTGSVSLRISGTITIA